MIPSRREVIDELVEILRSLQIAPRRVLIVSGGNERDLPGLMRELAEQVDGQYVDHLADCLPRLSHFPLEGYKARDLRDDLRDILDRGRKILILAELEWVLSIWDGGEQRRFFRLMATFAHMNPLVLACRLPLDYEALIGDRSRVFRF